MHTITVHTPPPYPVHIGAGLLSGLGTALAALIPPCRAAIVTDDTVDALYGRAASDSLAAAGFTPLRFAFPAGEKSKTLRTLGDILEFFGSRPLSRTDIVVALGGGVPGDVAGFAAAVYARGIPFIQVPTTLLAAVDSSVGGKTAVDLDSGKNLAGCFHSPRMVWTDTDILRKLPAERKSEGTAEIIKAGVLKSPALFERMCAPDWTEAMDEIVAQSVQIKRDLVEADPRDQGERRLLNLGHTFGHAIEQCSGFAIPHGQAVALGMVLSACAANQRDIARDIARANRNCGLPVFRPASPAVLARAALGDKKRRGDTVTVVLPEAIGHCRLQPVPVQELEALFASALSRAEAWQL